MTKNNRRKRPRRNPKESKVSVPFRSYSHAVQYIESFQPRGIRLGLSRVRRLLAALGDPHLVFPAIVVGGTNGKGSVVAMLASILKEAGYRIGQYTSPHLFDYVERIQVGGMPIPKRRVVEGMAVIRRAVEKIQRAHPRFYLTSYELLTVLAFWYFATQRVQMAVLEVGLGARLDAVNVVRRLGVVITNMDYDHQAYLGHRLGEIAAEKGGLIQRGVPVVTAATRPSALQVLRVRAAQQGAPFHAVLGTPEDFVASISLVRRTRVWVSGTGSYRGWFPLPLKGLFQIPNLLCVLKLLAVVPELSVSPQVVRRGLARTAWPGRFEVVARKPLMVLDIAHNPAGGAAVAADFAAYGVRPAMIVGVQATKDARGVVRELARHAEVLVATQASDVTCASPRVLSKVAQRTGVASVETASLFRAIRLVEKSFAALCITGSIHTVVEAKRILHQLGYTKRLC